MRTYDFCMMKPTKIVLERTATHFQLKVFAPNTAKGYFVSESVPINKGASLPNLRKQMVAYSKRFGIPFVDQTLPQTVDDDWAARFVGNVERDDA